MTHTFLYFSTFTTYLYRSKTSRQCRTMITIRICCPSPQIRSTVSIIATSTLVMITSIIVRPLADKHRNKYTKRYIGSLYSNDIGSCSINILNPAVMSTTSTIINKYVDNFITNNLRVRESLPPSR